jgi:hypothetical protein
MNDGLHLAARLAPVSRKIEEHDVAYSGDRQQHGGKLHRDHLVPSMEKSLHRALGSERCAPRPDGKKAGAPTSKRCRQDC